MNLSLPSLAKKLDIGSVVKAWHPIKQYIGQGKVASQTNQGYLVVFDGESSRLFVDDFEIAVVRTKP